MGVRIRCDKKEILDVRNAIFAFLHERILEIVEEQELELSDNLQDMLEKMDQNIYGRGCVYVDVADYIKTKRDLEVFTYLVKQGIETDTWVMPAAKGPLERLWTFHAELLKYGEKLS